MAGITRAPVSMPLGIVLPFAGSTAPSNYLLCDGSSLSTTTYAALFGVVGYSYGGSGANFNVPDLRGRAIAGKDDMGGTAASRLTATVLSAANTLGATGGAQTHTLTTAQLATHSHSNTLSDPGHLHGTIGSRDAGGGFGVTNLSTGYVYNTDTTSSSTGISISNANAGSGSAHTNTQPTLVLNYIIRSA